MPAVIGVMILAATAAGMERPRIKVVHFNGVPTAVAVRNMPAAVAERLAAPSTTFDDFAAVFAVGVVPPNDKPVTPMLGKYAVAGTTLTFTPRFPFSPGSDYQALLNHGDPPGRTRDNPILHFTAPRAEGVAPVVQAIHPTTAVLPENHLRFYLHFSAPMMRGEAYRRVLLLDGYGKIVADPFLELGEELWDPSGKRLTLLLDPGRVKRGLKPREDVGPVLVA
ncbi:MAG: hypothetical protein ACRDD1_07500, partial [Planctomycetia bacterium]